MIPKSPTGRTVRQDCARRKRHAATELKLARLAVIRRDGPLCRVCRRAGAIHGHHVVFRSQGGGHNPRNLIGVCGPCHAAIHGRKIVITASDAGAEGLLRIVWTGPGVMALDVLTFTRAEQ